jgi:hypothetical protein
MAIETTTTHCPAAALGESVQRLVELYHATDEARARQEMPQVEYDRAAETITARLNASIEWASHLPAQSAKGAAFQMIAISDLATALVGLVSPTDEVEGSKLESAIRRLAHSAAAYLSNSEGFSLNELGASYYLSATSNPHGIIDSATKYLEAQGHPVTLAEAA